MATLEELMQQGIDPDNRKAEAPDGLKGLGYAQRQKLRKQQAEQAKLDALNRNQSVFGSQDEYVVPDIGYRKEFENPSKFDAAIGNYLQKEEEGQTLGDARGELQTSAGKVLNSLINNVAIAGSTAVLGTMSFLDGLIGTMFTGENHFGDNVFSQAQNDFLKWMEENVPSYRGNEYENKNLWEKMGTVTFWGDFIKNLGYTEGMLLPGMGAAGAAGKVANFFGAGAETANIVAKLTGSAVSAMTEASTEAVSNMENQKQYKLNILQDSYDEKMRKARQSGDQAEMYKLYKEKETALNAIDEDATRTANYIFWANTGLLMATNFIEFGNIFGKSYDTGRRSLLNKVKIKAPNAAGKLEEVAARDVTKSMLGNLTAEGISKGKEIARIVGKKTLDSASEAFEEVSQSIISHTPEISKNYNTFNEVVLNPDKKELVDGFLSGWFKSVTDTLKDKNTAVEAMMGFLTGFLGAPTYVKGSGITWGNGVITEINRAAREGRLSRQAAENINDIMQHISTDEQFLARYKGLIRSQAFEDMKNNALELGDKVEYKNAESAQFISDVETFRKAGQIGMFKQIFNMMADISDEDVATLIKNTTDEKGNGPFSKAGKADSIEEAKESIRERANKYLGNIDRIVEDAERLEADPNLRASRLSDDEFNTLLFLKEQGYNFNERIGTMLNELAVAFKYGKYDEITEAATKILDDYKETVAKNNEKNERLRSYNANDIKEGRVRAKKVAAVADYLQGKIGKEALGRDDMRLLDAVLTGNYARYIAQPNEVGTYDVLDPADFDTLTKILNNNRASFAEGIQTIINSFKNNTLQNLILNLPNVINSFALLTQALNEDALNDETTQTLEDIKTLIKDIQRVSTASEYYNSEFNRLYKEYSQSARNHRNRKEVKESAEKAVDDVKNKNRADKIRKTRQAAGEDVSNKTDNEILHEEELKKDGADIAKSEYETIRNKILNSVKGLEDTEKELLKEHVDSLVDPILVDLEDSDEQTKESKYKEAISTLLNHDNYSSLLVSPEHLKEIKDAVRKMSEDREAFTETSEPEPQEESKKRFIESVPLEKEKRQSPQSPAESVNKNPIDAIVNSAPELVYEFENTKWAQTPIYIADTEQRKQILKEAKAKGVPEFYINDVNFLHSAGAYDAVRELVADAFKKGKKLPVKFMMIEADANKFEAEEGNPESKTNKIYHVIDVTDNEDWVRDHNNQLFEYKGKKYQVIGVHPENLNINGLRELNAKLRKNSNGNFENNVWVSDTETFLTNMSRGVQDKGSKIRTLKEFIDYNRLPLKDIILGHVLTNESSKSMVFVNEKGEIEEAATGDMSAEFGTFLVMDSSDPNLHRYAKLTIPTIKEYLENNPDTQFTNMLIDTFTGIAKEYVEHVGKINQETLKKLLNTLHNLIYFGKNDTNGDIGINSFDNGDTVGLVISMTSNKEGSEPQRTQLSISKNVSDAELRNIMKDFVLGRFKELTDSDALKFTTKDGGKFPLFRITMVAPKQYTNGSTSIEYAARALGLKGDPNTALKEFIINNNLLKTDLNSTKELNVKYYLAKYSPESNTFEEVKYRPSKPESAVKQQPVTPQGVETSQKKNSITVAIPVTAFSSNRKGNIQVTATIEDSKLVIRNKEGKNLNAIFDKAYMDELQQAMETNSALPKAPEFYTLTDGGKLYIAYYNNKGQLEVVDRDYDFIKDADEKVRIRKAFNEKINPDPIKKEIEDAKTLKPSDALAGLLDDDEGTPSSQPTAEPVKNAASEELPETTKRGLEGAFKTLISMYDKLRRAGGTEEGTKKIILNKAKQVCDTDAEYNYLVNKITEVLNSERGKKYSTAEPKANLKKELAWVNKALPQTANRIRIIQGFVRLLSDPSGLYVGKFLNDSIELSENYATKGVAYHEAFHFVFNVLMNNTEREYLLRNARKSLGENTSVIDAEEWLADMFADYVGKKETGFWNTKIGKALSTIFSWLKDMLGIANTNQSKINEVFNSIYKGEFANREMQEVSAERGKLYSEDVVNGAMYAFAQKLHADSIQRYKEGLVLSYTRKEHLRNEDFAAFKEALKNYPVTVTSLSPSKLASVRNGRSVEANSGDECGILVSYSKEREQQMEKQFKKEEQDLKYTTVQNERHAQNVELAYEACEGTISKEELKAMSDSTLEQIIYCK